MGGNRKKSFEEKIHFLEENSKYFCEVKKISLELSKKNLPVVITCDDFLLRKWFSLLICYCQFNDLSVFYSLNSFKLQDEKFKNGLVKMPGNSVLFLDRIEMMSDENQMVLLQAIESGFLESRNIKVLCGTSIDLNYLSETGKFNSNLAFRLNLYSRPRILSLNENRSDIRVIADLFFLDCKNITGLPFSGFSENAYKVLEEHFWKGGCFELKAAVERAFAVGQLPLIRPSDFCFMENKLSDTASFVVEAAESLTGDAVPEDDKTLKTALDSFKREYVIKILAENGNNQTKAAKVLGLQRTYVSRLMSELQIR